MSATTAPAPDAAEDERTRFAFSFDEDHCTYDPDRILTSFSSEEVLQLTAIFGPDTAYWTDSTSLYCAVEELEELGHDDLATRLGQCIHDEQLYVCRCTNEAFDAFKKEVQDHLDEIYGRLSNPTWVDDTRVHPYGLDVDTLLTDVFGTSEASDTRNLVIELDDQGNGQVTRRDQSATFISFTAPEVASFVLWLDGGDIGSTEHGYATVEDFLELPEDVRMVMATLRHHDIRFSGDLLGTATGIRAMDLFFEPLADAARSLLALPGPTAQAVIALLPGLQGPVEDLIEAVEAAVD